ncbi:MULTISPECIES: iron transporter [unclassified Actinomyces]|uniref:iron transporter n=1 Tax=unclassified Actinomyces TaxID=2609248 RepID=UPI000D59EA01|nr:MULTISPECIES: iron transporter [unclassified Actinomyces]RAX22617.1 amino acid ABC transporter substrate-binding protein [Actinomyces sp. Z5]RAX23568.1 amino acid ABC transporter substrate-binding protein [Actinomyces sp. Z3]
MRSLKLVSAAGALVLVGTLGLAACSSSDDAADTSTDAATEAAADAGNDAGFEEFNVNDSQVDQEAEGQISVNLVYFQPVDMEPAGAAGLAASDASFHMEADVSALADNTLGYGAGDFVPGLTVDYSIAPADGSGEAVEGTFMQMNASDGPHYGANIALEEAGQYTVTITIHSPEENGWVLHTDPETGVEGRFWNEPIELTWDWDYTPMEW